jgi:hypothetical protein
MASARRMIRKNKLESMRREDALTEIILNSTLGSRRRGTSRKTSVRIGGVPAEIRIEQLLNTSQKRSNFNPFADTKLHKKSVNYLKCV